MASALFYLFTLKKHPLLDLFFVLVQLLFKSLNAIKALLVAQSKTEGDGHGLTVDVAIEIEDVCLNGGG